MALVALFKGGCFYGILSKKDKTERPYLSLY